VSLAPLESQGQTLGLCRLGAAQVHAEQGLNGRPWAGAKDKTQSQLIRHTGNNKNYPPSPQKVETLVRIHFGTKLSYFSQN
jgi:hypothetical protein